MAKKTSSSGGSEVKRPIGPLIGLLGHIVAAARGVYHCTQHGCSGTLNATFKCRRCGRRGFPGFGRA